MKHRLSVLNRRTVRLYAMGLCSDVVTKERPCDLVSLIGSRNNHLSVRRQALSGHDSTATAALLAQQCHRIVSVLEVTWLTFSLHVIQPRFDHTVTTYPLIYHLITYVILSSSFYGPTKNSSSKTHILLLGL